MTPLRLLASSLALALAVESRLAAQTPAQNDSSIRAAARTSGLPLLTPRKLTFTTDDASWISLDVAPDGKTIAFDILGDLYTLPVTGGTGWDQQPRYSPDGKQIAFVSDRNGSKNIWIANADGSRVRILTKSERINFASPIWSADGQYVIAGRAGPL